MPPGVQIRPRAYSDFSRVVRAYIEVEQRQADAFYGWLDQQLGKPYDWLSIISFAVGRNWRNDEAWFCSEIQARALELAGVFTKPLYLAANKIAPVPLALAISALPSARFETY